VLLPLGLQGPFDVAVFNAVFGNLHDPRQALLRTSLLMRPGGCGGTVPQQLLPAVHLWCFEFLPMLYAPLSGIAVCMPTRASPLLQLHRHRSRPGPALA
jgi:uncharacterized phage infection (PIP) family protein YhgE